MNSSTFWRAVIAGFLATFVMTMTGFWQGSLGFLARMDVAGMVAGSMGQSWDWGWLTHHLNGVILALVYVRWIHGRLPGGNLLQGWLYGGIGLTAAAALVVVPLANPDAGILFSKTPMPGKMLLSSFVAHSAYGVALGLAFPARPTGSAAAGVRSA